MIAVLISNALILYLSLDCVVYMEGKVAKVL